MIEFLTEVDENILLADGFEDALLGYVTRFGSPPVALYDEQKCIEILVKRDGMTTDEAIEFFEYNVLGSYAGEYTPAFANLIK